MPAFLNEALAWARFSGSHFLIMFWWIWVSAVVLTAFAEASVVGPLRRRLRDAGASGWRPLALAIALGVLSPPSRRRIFRTARELLAEGAPPAIVVGYLLSAQTLLLWLLLFVVELDGPQPALGQVVAVGVALTVMVFALRTMPTELWDEARRSARGDTALQARPVRLPLRWVRSVVGQAYSLWWPLVFGLGGIGLFLAFGQSDAYLSLQGDRGPLVQLGNAVVGLLLAYVTGAPLIGNALMAAGIWKAQLVTYAGLSAFLLGTTLNPFVLPRYYSLLGVELGRKLLLWLVVAIVAGALVAAAWWWGLDWLAGVGGVREWFETFSHSTLRPNDVPWFHHWFQPKPMAGM